MATQRPRPRLRPKRLLGRFNLHLGVVAFLLSTCCGTSGSRPPAITGASNASPQLVVQDRQGNGLPGATVSICVGGREIRTAVSDALGRVTFRNLQPGDYPMAVELPNFRTVKASPTLRVAATATSPLVVTLEVFMDPADRIYMPDPSAAPLPTPVPTRSVCEQAA